MGYSRHILSLPYSLRHAVPRQLQLQVASARAQLSSKVILGALYGPVVHSASRGLCTGINCNHHSKPTDSSLGSTTRVLPPINNPIRHRTRSASTSTSTSNAIPKLDLPAIDQKWRAHLTNPPKGPENGEKFYILPMFPYPSGTLHLGHLRVYTISDVIARFRRMQGYNVVHPMGWDSFGLPAENAAIERGVKPGDWTVQNVERMKEQLGGMMGGFNWEREVMTSSPEYYAHTQRLFLLLHKHGLAYRAESLVNWDPVDKTVLANEQVSASGHSWRSGALVEKKMLKQWFFKITEYADELLDGLREGDKALEGWPERVKTMQENWIGKSEGAKTKFTVLKNGEKESFGEAAAMEKAKKRAVEVFTTRVDTLLGAQYLALSHSHSLVKEAAQTSPELRAYLEECASNPATNPPTSNSPNDLPKRGFRLPGIFAASPLKPDIFAIPIYAAEYVLEGYGSGAVMGVPAHDIRDNAFFKTQFPPDSTPLHVVMPADSEGITKDAEKGKVWTKQGILTPNCGPEFSGLTSSEAVDKICDTLNLAQRVSQYRLRDWLVSRQRYWGAPIPIIHCPSCGEVPVPDDNLPVLLPEDVDISGKGGSPLSTAQNGTWADCTCPKCSQPAKRDTDTMDTFVDSSWYFMRFSDSRNSQQLFSPEKAKKLLPVDVYIGGVEHAILHLLYSRFISKFLSKIGLWPQGKELYSGEPFRKLLTQGMVHGKTYSDPLTGRFLKPEELIPDPKDSREMVFYRATEEDSQEASQKREPVKPNISFEKMSKSKYNGVDPALTISTWGSDTTRAHILFAAPVADVVEWDETKIIGMKRWLGRVWRIVGELDSQLSAAKYISPEQERDIFDISTCQDPMGDIRGWLEKGVFGNIGKDLELLIATCKTINSATGALGEAFTLNTLVSDLIKLTNEVFSTMTTTADSSSQGVSLAGKIVATRSLLALMGPVCPSIVSEAGEWFNGRVRERGGAHQKQVHLIKNESPNADIPLTWPTSSTELLSHLEELHLHSSSSLSASSSQSQSNILTQTQTQPNITKKIIIQVNSRVKFTLARVSFLSPLQPQDIQEHLNTPLLLSKIFTDPSVRKWWFGNPSSLPLSSPQEGENEIPKIGDIWPASPSNDGRGSTLQLKDIMIRDSGKVCVVNFVVG